MYLKCFINCDIILILFPILTKIADTTESSSFFEVFLPFSKCFWKHFKMFSIIDTYFFAFFDVTNSKDLQVSLVSNRFCVRSARMVKSSWIWKKGLSLDLTKWILYVSLVITFICRVIYRLIWAWSIESVCVRVLNKRNTKHGSQMNEQ